MNKKFVIIFSTILVLTGTAIISSEQVLQKIGNYLVYQGPLEPAEAIIVLSGSGTGNRIEAGAELFKKGLGKFIVISGDEVYPGYYTHTLMKNYAINMGVPEDKIIASAIEGEISTWGEGIDNLGKLKENNFKSFILVTSAFHSYRAHIIYDQLISDLGYSFKWSVYPANDPQVPIKDWWQERAARKVIFIEFIKLLYFFIEH
jgi:uncharacterized SAM-binding protein YcdF (DUF218 family)